MRDYVWPNLSPGTARSYDSIVRCHLIPKLGSVSLVNLKPEHIQKYYSETLRNGRCADATGLSARSVRHHHTTLHKALQSAVEWGLLSRNVADAIKPPHFQRPEMQTWGEKEIIQFLKVAGSTHYYALFYTALFTGMRTA